MDRILNAILGVPGFCVFALAFVTVPPHLSAIGNARVGADCRATDGVPTWAEVKSIDYRHVGRLFTCALPKKSTPFPLDEHRGR